MKRRLGLLLLVALTVSCSGRRPRTGPPPGPEPVPLEGIASWYGLEEKGRPTANGEPMDPERMTAAHRTLPFGTRLRVTDLDTGKSVEVVVNDRGPFVEGRILDLSYASARELGILGRGLARVRLTLLGEDPHSARRWRVQVGSFLVERRAWELSRALQEEGYEPVVVSTYDEASSRYYRVWVGKFEEREEAQRLAERLSRAGRWAVPVATSAAP